MGGKDSMITLGRPEEGKQGARRIERREGESTRATLSDRPGGWLVGQNRWRVTGATKEQETVHVLHPSCWRENGGWADGQPEKKWLQMLKTPRQRNCITD